MFRPMRRTQQQLSQSQCEAILRSGSSGVLALAGDEGYPYALPISYVYACGKLFFHCAATGHKLDALRRCEKVSFCVVARDDVDPAEYTTHYRSVIAFGALRILEDPVRIRTATDCLARKYAPADLPENRTAAIDRNLSGLRVLEMEIHHLTGKTSRENP